MPATKINRIPENELFQPAACPGKTYEAEVPDTLDLPERCRLGLLGVANTTDPNCYYQMWFLACYNTRQPYMSHNASDACCNPKFIEAFPMLRQACGTQDFFDFETQQMAHMLAGLSPDDGLLYLLWKPDRSWHSSYYGPDAYKSKNEDYSHIHPDGRFMRAMMSWRERDGDKRWDDRIRGIARGLAKIAIDRGDYAYYPDGGHSMQFSYPRSGWISTNEPKSDNESAEGSVMDTIGHVIYGLSRWHLVDGDKEALALARKVANFTMLPKMWGGLVEDIGICSAEQGHFHTHTHGHMVGLRGLLEYGHAANDQRVLEFVRRSYEHMREYMVPRTGFFPTNGVGSGGYFCMAEGCNLGDQIALGIRLSDFGLGDYWDDVDAVVRNLLMDQQLTDANVLRRITELCPVRTEQAQFPGQETTENMPDRLVGIFASWASGNSLPAMVPIMGCCTGNATQGLGFAWEGALRCDGDSAKINLLINRASRLCDVHSYIPYEGKVVIHNKAAHRVAVRILNWIDRRQLRATVSGQQRPQILVGNYLLVDDLKPGDKVVLEFPVPESTASYTAHHKVWHKEKVYTYKFRGSTCVEVSPKDTNPTSIPIFERGHMLASKAPMKKTTMFVPDKIITGW